MLDISLVLQEAEAVLDDHYNAWKQQGSGRVRVYHMPQKRQVPVTVTKEQNAGHPASSDRGSKVALPPASSPRSLGISEVVANVVVLLLLNVLNDKLSRKGAR